MLFTQYVFVKRKNTNITFVWRQDINTKHRDSLVVQWLRFQAPSAGGPGWITGEGTIFHMPQLRVPMLQPKICHATMKIDLQCLN